MVQKANYCWTVGQVTLSCLSDASPYIYYRSFASKTKSILVGNGQYVSVLFLILVILDIHGHTFEMYALVSDIHESIDLA